jgi:hypothetical protein
VRIGAPWLTRYGGFVLLGLGLVALVVGLVVGKELLAVAGLATAAFGVVLERLEGPVEAGVQGFKGHLISREELVSDVRLRAQAELTPTEAEERIQEVERLLPVGQDIVISGSAGKSGGKLRLQGGSETIKPGSIPSEETFGSPRVFTRAEYEEGYRRLRRSLANSLFEAAAQTRCARCGHPIDDPTGTPPEKRTPCPNCGSTDRSFGLNLEN